jgi:hypothetical protein
MTYNKGDAMPMKRLRKFFASADALLDRPMRVAVIAAFVILVLHWAVVIAFIYARLGTLDFLRLHYTAAEGVDWVDRWQSLLIFFPGFGFVVFFVNLTMACLLARRRKTLGRIILVATVIVEALLAVGGTIAVLLNG